VRYIWNYREDNHEATRSEVDKAKRHWQELLSLPRGLEESHAGRTPGRPGVRRPHADDVVVQLARDQVEFLSRPIHGQGGYQSLLRGLQDNTSEGFLRLSHFDCERIVRCATEYGEGGFQGRLRSVIEPAGLFIS
jgi:hypothetical protein